MSIITIATTVTAGAKILASEINGILSALRLQFVGRNSSGVPTAGQDLGTATYPWGNVHGTDLFVDDITLDGRPVVKEKVQRSRNGIISARTRTTSGQPDFIRADGATNEATILATSTALKMVINDEIVEVTADITVTGLTSGSFTTAGIANTPSLSDEEFTKYLGEENGVVYFSTAGSPTTLFNETVCVENLTSNELMFGTLKQMPGSIPGVQAYLERARRGWFFDSTGTPNDRDTINSSDSVYIHRLGWLFIQNNGTTVDTSYRTPIYAEDQPTTDLAGASVADGQYWFDLDEETWKRYNGSTWETLNRTLLGYVVIDETGDCVASRSLDFDNDYRSDNNVRTTIESVTELKTLNQTASLSVYGKTITKNYSPWVFTMPTDLETGSEESKIYYAYITETGEQKLSLTKPQIRGDLQGAYHPFQSWRCVSQVNNESGDFELKCDIIEKAYFQASPGRTGTAATTITATSGTPKDYDPITFETVLIDSLINWDDTQKWFRLKEGELYKVRGRVSVDSLISFTGSANDTVVSIMLQYYDTVNDDEFSSEPWARDQLLYEQDVSYNTTSLFSDKTIIFDTNVRGYRDVAIRIAAYKDNCTSVVVTGRDLEIEQL